MSHLLRRLARWLIAPIAAAAIAGPAAADTPRPWRAHEAHTIAGKHAGPYEFIVKNRLPHRYGMTEIRALNDRPDGGFDLGVTSSTYDDPGNGGLVKNTAFLVSESGLDGMHIKSNNGPIDFTTWPRPVMRLEHGQVKLFPQPMCPAAAPARGVTLCVAGDGALYATASTGRVTALARPDGFTISPQATIAASAAAGMLPALLVWFLMRRRPRRRLVRLPA